MESTIEDRALASNDVVDRTREFVRSLLDQGVKASEVSATLAYVATELGLYFAKQPVQVFPVVLDAISRAVTAARAGRDEDAPQGANTEAVECATDGVTLH